MHVYAAPVNIDGKRLSAIYLTSCSGVALVKPTVANPVINVSSDWRKGNLIFIF